MLRITLVYARSVCRDKISAYIMKVCVMKCNVKVRSLIWSIQCHNVSHYTNLHTTLWETMG